MCGQEVVSTDHHGAVWAVYKDVLFTLMLSYDNITARDSPFRTSSYRVTSLLRIVCVFEYTGTHYTDP